MTIASAPEVLSACSCRNQRGFQPGAGRRCLWTPSAEREQYLTSARRRGKPAAFASAHRCDGCCRSSQLVCAACGAHEVLTLHRRGRAAGCRGRHRGCGKELIVCAPDVIWQSQHPPLQDDHCACIATSSAWPGAASSATQQPVGRQSQQSTGQIREALQITCQLSVSLIPDLNIDWSGPPTADHILLGFSHRSLSLSPPKLPVARGFVTGRMLTSLLSLRLRPHPLPQRHTRQGEGRAAGARALRLGARRGSSLIRDVALGALSAGESHLARWNKERWTLVIPARHDKRSQDNDRAAVI